LETSRNYSFAIFSTSYCISFSWTSLTICKNTNIKSIDSTLYKHLSIFKNFILCGFLTKARIKNKLFESVLILLLSLRRLNLVRWFIELLILFDSNSESKLIDKRNCINTAHSHFIYIHWPDSTVYSDLALHVFNLIMKSFSLYCLCLIFQPKSIILVP
jgi:hypothetical protein